jgi:DNA-binding transcriptional LysR family regulator
MELRQLEYFQMVSRLNSITRAAGHLRVAQPSVTVAIRKLEEELGVLLFDRSQKRITLTAEGAAFARHADDILARVGDSVREMDDYRLLKKGTIKIGIPPMVGAFIFPYIFAGFRQAYPWLELSVVEKGSLAIRSHLERGELDVGIVIISDPSPKLETVFITESQLLVCLPPAHPLGGLACVPFGELRNEPFVLLKEDTYNRRVIVEECRRHHFAPRIVFSSSQLETILGLIRQGVGLSFLLDAVVRSHPDILSLPLAEPLKSEIGLAWNRERYLSKAAKAFVDFIGSSLPSGR